MATYTWVQFFHGHGVVYNLRKQSGKFAKWAVCWRRPAIVQRKLNDSNYVLHKGKGKCVVVHVDRMRKLPISSDVEPSVESSDSHMHTRENKEPTIPLASGVGHSLLQTCLAFIPRKLPTAGTGQIVFRL